MLIFLHFLPQPIEGVDKNHGVGDPTEYLVPRMVLQMDTSHALRDHQEQEEVFLALVAVREHLEHV